MSAGVYLGRLVATDRVTPFGRFTCLRCGIRSTYRNAPRPELCADCTSLGPWVTERRAS